jgi:hypothetical protein
MAARSLEEKLQAKVHENLMRMDFDTARFAAYMHRCGVRTQIRLFNVFVNLIRHWAIDYDAGEADTLPPLATQQEKDEYLNMLTYSKRIQENLNI